jgi:hypothetical protein
MLLSGQNVSSFLVSTFIPIELLCLCIQKLNFIHLYTLRITNYEFKLKYVTDLHKIYTKNDLTIKI